MQTIERSKIAKELEAFCDKYDTYSAAAKALGITLAQLSTARNDESTVIPAKALAKLGYGYALVYVRKADMPAKRAKKTTAKPKSKPAAKPKAKKPAPKPVKAKSKPAVKPKAKAPAKTKAKKPAKKKKAADKPAAAPVSTPAAKPAPKPRPAKPVVSAPPVQRDVPASPPPEKVVEVTNPSNGAFE